MPKKTPREVAGQRLRKRKHLWEAFTRNPAFENFCQNTIKQVKKYVAWLKEAETDLPEPLKGPYDPEYHVCFNFLQTSEGEALAERLKLLPLERSPVWPLKLEGHILSLEIALTHSKTEIFPALVFELRRSRRRVLGNGRVRTSSPGLPILSQYQEERKEGSFLILELNLRQRVKEILAAVKLLLPQSRPTGPGQKLKRKVSPWEAWDAVKKEQSFRKTAWRLGVRESTLKEAFYQAFELVNGEAYKALKDHPDKTPPPEMNCRLCFKRDNCNEPCPSLKALLKREEGSLRELLPKTPL